MLKPGIMVSNRVQDLRISRLWSTLVDAKLYNSRPFESNFANDCGQPGTQVRASCPSYAFLVSSLL